MHNARHVIKRIMNPRFLNSVSSLVSNLWYRIPIDQSEPAISEITPTDSPKVGPVAIPE